MEYVSSRGILKSCDYHSDKPISSIKRMVFYPQFVYKEKPVIYVCGSAIPHFRTMMPQYPFILVTGDCDETMPDDVMNDFTNFISNPNLLHWFSQNMTVTHPKVTRIPIGLDYHTMTTRDVWGPIMSEEKQERLLKAIQKSKYFKHFKERKMMCYANYHFQMNTKHGYDRKDALSVPKHLVYYEPTKIPRFNTWMNQIEYAFVISPHGGGYDCHRLWEALILGCIPIVKTSPIDPLYDGLPVLIVKKWSDVTEELLNTVNFDGINFDGIFHLEKLKLNYWMNKINIQLL
jgi:hypothetical protein